MPAASSTVPALDRSTSTIGIRRAPCVLIAAANTGLSAIPSRTHKPTATSTALAMNGIRHAHAANSAEATDVEATRNTRFDRMMPAGSPSATMLPKSPRRPSGACSIDIRMAPPHSPPSANPWTKRSTTSSTGAQAPIWA